MPDSNEAGHPELKEQGGERPADAAAPNRGTGYLEGGDGEKRSRTARREGLERAWRHHSRAHGPKDRSGGTLAPHQTFLSAQTCRSGRTLNNAQPVSVPNLVTDEAVEEDTGKPMLVELFRWTLRGKTYSTLGGHRTKFLTHGAPAPGVCLVQVTGLWIPHSRTGGNRTLISTPEKGKKGANPNPLTLRVNTHPCLPHSHTLGTPWPPLCRLHELRSVECPSCRAQALLESFDKNPLFTTYPPGLLTRRHEVPSRHAPGTLIHVTT